MNPAANNQIKRLPVESAPSYRDAASRASYLRSSYLPKTKAMFSQLQKWLSLRSKNTLSSANKSLKLFCCFFAILFVHNTYASPIKRAYDCFSGPFESYASFTDSVERRNSAMEPEKLANVIKMIRTRFPEEDYTYYRNNLKCEFFTYSVDGIEVDGFIVHPVNATGLPTVIYNRGGNGAFGAMTFMQLFKDVFDLSARGFTVIGSQYRGASKRHAGVIKDEFGGEDVKDVLALSHLIKHFPAADEQRVSMIGYSRGSMQSMLALKNGLAAHKVALLAGEYNLAEELKFRPEMEIVYKGLIPGYAENKEATLRDRSALFWTGELPQDTKYLLVHGTEDKAVRIESSEALYSKMKTEGFDIDLMVLQDGHALSKERDVVLDRLIQFLQSTPPK